MAGKREKQNNRRKWGKLLVLMLWIVGGLLVIGGGIPAASDNEEILPTDTVAEWDDTYLQILQPKKEIVPLALPGEVNWRDEMVEAEPAEPVPPDPEKPMIALTFDDGPGEFTERLLEILRQHGAKATFFVVGRNIEAHKDVLRQAAEAGHEVGGHSWNHPQLVKIGNAAVADQILKTKNKIAEVTGMESHLMRPPYGAHNKSVRAVAAEQQVVLINWSVDPKDWQLRNSEKVYQAIVSRVKDGDIILCHDIHETTVDAMERVIPDLIAQGYQFVTVSELLTSRGEEMVPGTVYLKGKPA